jgi:hypothetical protein
MATPARKSSRLSALSPEPVAGRHATPAQPQTCSCFAARSPKALVEFVDLQQGLEKTKTLTIRKVANKPLQREASQAANLHLAAWM